MAGKATVYAWWRAAQARTWQPEDGPACGGRCEAWRIFLTREMRMQSATHMKLLNTRESTTVEDAKGLEMHCVVENMGCARSVRTRPEISGREVA
jgi:hypothetical protein